MTRWIWPIADIFRHPHKCHMVWDLRAALLKKEEFETARLIDFEFRLRVRIFRLLAAPVNVPEDSLVQQIVTRADQSILMELGRFKIVDMAQLPYLRALATQQRSGRPNAASPGINPLPIISAITKAAILLSGKSKDIGKSGPTKFFKHRVPNLVGRRQYLQRARIRT